MLVFDGHLDCYQGHPLYLADRQINISYLFNSSSSHSKLTRLRSNNCFIVVLAQWTFIRLSRRNWPNDGTIIIHELLESSATGKTTFLTNALRETIFHSWQRQVESNKPTRVRSPCLLFSPKLSWNGWPETQPSGSACTATSQSTRRWRPPQSIEIYSSVTASQTNTPDPSINGSTFSPFAKILFHTIRHFSLCARSLPFNPCSAYQTQPHAKNENWCAKDGIRQLRYGLANQDVRHNEMRGLRVAGKHL